MEFADLIDDITGNTNDVKKSDLYTKHVGYTSGSGCIADYFSRYTVHTISNQITNLLMGVHPENRPIIVPDQTIYNVMDSVYNTYRPPTGDIYGRYNIPSGTTTESYVQDMIDQVIEIIVADVRNNYEIAENNAKLSAWTTVMGSFNDHGLRAHPEIKVRLKAPQRMMFNMNY